MCPCVLPLTVLLYCLYFQAQLPGLRYCQDERGQGPWLPHRLMSKNTSVTPIWVATNESELAESLGQAAAYLQDPSAVVRATYCNQPTVSVDCI